MSEITPARLPPPKGAFKIASLLGIDVHVHWAWIIVVVIAVQIRSDAYSGVLWNVVEILALFGIVVLHEFGHALACKSVKGQAEHVLLWPLGGVAYVRPPQRPGATLWVSAAGPLVNVVLVPFTIGASLFFAGTAPDSDLATMFHSLLLINLAVLVFNLLPVYPLDGGKMLRSLLWFGIGPHRSLVAATVVGLVGSVGLLIVAITVPDDPDLWLILIALFTISSSWGGFKLARARLEAARLSRRQSHRCPSCGEPPPLGACWPCPACGTAFDAFEDRATCPHCRNRSATVVCPYCGDAPPYDRFFEYEVR